MANDNEKSLVELTEADNAVPIGEPKIITVTIGHGGCFSTRSKEFREECMKSQPSNANGYIIGEPKGISPSRFSVDVLTPVQFYRK